MKIVLLSGGSGKRLWPLSNDTRSKQFLKVLLDSNGNNQSMVQRVWTQLISSGLSDSSVIATSKLQTEMIYQQLGDKIPLIVEPERRDTFPAIALAATFLYSEQQTSLDETIVVLPVDPYVEDQFFQKIKQVDEVLHLSKADLVLIGVKPTYPSTKYGYIVPRHQSPEGDFFIVDRFTEKPIEEHAEQLISEGAYWNCGVFAFRLGYLINMLQEKGLPLRFKDMLNQYPLLPNISFDYEVVEKANELIVLPYDGYWKDLGTWNTLTEEMSETQMGKGVITDDCINTHLVNELDIPVTILGTSDIVVAASPDGILVTHKDASPRIKEAIASFNQSPMYEERVWGWSKVLDYTKHQQEEMVTKRICIHEGKNSTFHYHHLRDEVWTITQGEGELILNESITRVKAGDIVHIAAGKKHAIRAIQELHFIEVQTGKEVVDTDFVRLCTSWDDILNHFKSSKAKVIS
ncbi:mannose-1-phosphate guanylyltransferase [Paenibacillus selenitireducens]|uniref:Mannose-1-phosphate guanylyltransferase n=1 Tax=Paenibacillus selenitireducens TaxID=1324314 RepID=A0A1T2XL72_9BACL|nr:sugar phosphate nucleotidyltransferase [Paenibacillus selenitireducens]OPA80476.1 mannose-1-phosphate guanylyltransferase [Paenibacillus selenitireducens]